MISISDITFAYDNKRNLFEHLSLELKPGRIYGLLGKNGAGKSTLLKLITGLRYARTGQITLQGEPVENRNSHTLAQYYFLPEEIASYDISTLNFAKMYGAFYPLFSMEDFMRYLSIFDIEETDKSLQKLSLGQKKKVHIAFALATHTPLLIFDEPTNGLDIPSKSSFRRAMAEAADSERLIIISTHQVRDLHSLIDNTIILDNGQILLNEANEHISEKLAFQVEHLQDNMEGVLYSEQGIEGILTVRENTGHIDSQVNLELLFNAAITCPERIKSIFNQ